MIRLLTEPTELGVAYRVDMRLRPEGSRGPLCLSFDSTLSYYDVKGRTWERQAYVKARPIAGDLELGSELLAQLEPWIYRRYLSLADITGIKSLKRRIEQRAEGEGGDLRNVKTGHGGIRDIEFVIQFLQLLNGGALPEVRTGNTLEAIARLEQAGCLTHQERTDARRQLQLPAQARASAADHVRPADARAARRPRRAGASWPCGWATPARRTLGRWRRSKTTTRSAPTLNRKILDHLLHDAFPGDARDRAGSRPGERSRSAAGANPAKCSAAIRFATCRRRTKT